MNPVRRGPQPQILGVLDRLGVGGAPHEHQQVRLIHLPVEVPVVARSCDHLDRRVLRVRRLQRSDQHRPTEVVEAIRAKGLAPRRAGQVQALAAAEQEQPVGEAPHAVVARERPQVREEHRRQKRIEPSLVRHAGIFAGQRSAVLPLCPLLEARAKRVSGVPQLVALPRAVKELLELLRHRLQLGHSHVQQRSVIKTIYMVLDEVAELLWVPWQPPPLEGAK
mmetsp:Transcript_8226/g.24392  ORF Transcript_8226/g.24392 Transcript_8226/m.24392 type:complete len:222 (+) Transcript_8226:284-949(+)